MVCFLAMSARNSTVAAMKQLDGDDGLLVSPRTSRSAARDIVQVWASLFNHQSLSESAVCAVPRLRWARPGAAGAGVTGSAMAWMECDDCVQEVLREVPAQVCGYYKAQNMQPPI